MKHHGVEVGGSFFRGLLVPPFVGLSHAGWRVLMHLVSYDYSLAKGEDRRKGYAYPGNAALAAETGVSLPTVKRALAVLDDRVYIARATHRRGKGMRDHRFIHINYPMLEHGHQCVLDCRSRRNATKRPQIEAACRRQLSEDALAFLARLLRDGALLWGPLLQRAEGSTCESYRGLIRELSIRLAGSDLHPPRGDLVPIKPLIQRLMQSVSLDNEEDEVHSLRRSAYKRDAEAASVAPASASTATAISSQAETNRPLAGAIREALVAVGLSGEVLERAIAISMHCCVKGGFVDPEVAASMVSYATEEVDWGDNDATDWFAHVLSHDTGCEWE